MKIMNSAILEMRNWIYNLKPEWCLNPVPSFNQQRPIVSNNLIDNFSRDLVTSVPGIKEILSSETVEVADGTRVRWTPSSGVLDTLWIILSWEK